MLDFSCEAADAAVAREELRARFAPAGRHATQDLVGSSGNPVPRGARPRLVRTADGVSLRAAGWQAEGARRGTLVLLQGRGDFIEKYFETVEDFRARGFDVVTFDWRGQGGSQRLLPDPRRGHVDDFAAYARDLAAVMGSIRGGGPCIALAHSMGAAILLQALAREPRLFDAALLSAPMIALSPAIKPPFAEGLCRALARAGLGEACVPGRARQALVCGAFHPGNILTSDPGRFLRWSAAAVAAPQHVLGKPTIGWLHAAFQAMAFLNDPAVPARMALPVLVAAGTDDRVTSTPAAGRFARRLPQGAWAPVAGARHELLMERDTLRAAFLAACDGFLDRLA